MQVSERWTIQQDELIKQLQDKVNSNEKMVVDIALFQAQALEVLKKLEIAQQSLLSKVKIVQNHSQVMDEALSNIVLRERERLSLPGLPSKKRLYHQQKKEELWLLDCPFQRKPEVILY
jgi:hypothetical protein